MMPLRLFKLFTLPLMLACAPLAWAGGEMGDPDHVDTGTPYFGFVKDADGKAVVDAKVTATIKDGTRLIARTNLTGMYNFGPLNENVRPDDVLIACSKEGYKQTRLIRRPPSPNSTVKAVETECRLQRG